jgi:hypothetical protein
MLRLKVGREAGPYWIEVESDSVEAKELVELLEKAVQDVNASINDARFEQIAGEIPILSPQMTLTECINEILGSRYGLRPRTLGEIQKVLEANNIFYPATTVSSVLISLWKRGRIRRWERNGKFVHQKVAN